MTDPFVLSLRLLVDLTAARRDGDAYMVGLLRGLLNDLHADLSGEERAAWVEVQAAMERAWPQKEASG